MLTLCLESTDLDEYLTASFCSFLYLHYHFLPLTKCFYSLQSSRSATSREYFLPILVLSMRVMRLSWKFSDVGWNPPQVRKGSEVVFLVFFLPECVSVRLPGKMQTTIYGFFLKITSALLELSLRDSSS